MLQVLEGQHHVPECVCVSGMVIENKRTRTINILMSGYTYEIIFAAYVIIRYNDL